LLAVLGLPQLQLQAANKIAGANAQNLQRNWGMEYKTSARKEKITVPHPKSPLAAIVRKWLEYKKGVGSSGQGILGDDGDEVGDPETAKVLT